MAGTPSNISYSTETNLTITLDSLASSATAGRESTSVSNITNKYLDAMVYLNLITAATTAASDKCTYVYAYGGTTPAKMTDNCTGVDAAITLVTPVNISLIKVINMLDTWTNYDVTIGSVASAFGGNLPPYWGIVVQNFTGMPIGTTSNLAWYVGVGQTTG